MYQLVLFGLFTKWFENFPTLSYTSATDTPTLSYTWNLRKGIPFGAELPHIDHLKCDVDLLIGIFELNPQTKEQSRHAPGII